MYARMNRVQAGAILLAVGLVAVPLVSVASAGAGPASGVPVGPAGAAEPSVQAGVGSNVVDLDARGVAGPATQGVAGPAAPEVAAVEADTVEFRITVFENASARWQFTYTRVLDNESERRQFESFAEEFERNETAAYRDFRQLARGLASSGRNATGREMTATGFSRSAGLGGDCVTRECGTITMGFTWASFAREDGERLVIGDVFGTGLYLSADQELVVVAGPGLAFDSVAPDTYNDAETPLAERRSITYQGEVRFSDRRPRVVFVPAEQADTTPTDTPGDTTGTTPATATTDREGGLPLALLGGLLVAAVGATAAFAYRRSGGTAPTETGGDDGPAGAGATSQEPVSGEPSVPDEELLTDEDRVLSLLEDNGGRMKQVDIVDETGWSKSKVSMLLSDMEDHDEISKLRVGRENIISLSGHEPEAASSPHDEE
jgi:hypothetical protein